uniref:Transcription elongation factor 1 homolog n=1 Tax=Oryza punctata TaxID=4537 RepID=A0A0E0LNP4_ORYPU
MGKRKSAAKPPPKKRMDKLDTVFSCPFCNHGSSVECRISHYVDTFMSVKTINMLQVYSEWIDECERVNNVEDDDGA